MVLNLNHCSCSRLDMTSWQQVAQFVPRVFNHQDCHHNGWVGHKRRPLCVEDSDKVCLCFKQSGNRRQENSVSFILMISEKMILQNRSIYEYLEAAINNQNGNWHNRLKTLSKYGAVQWTKQPQMALRFWTINSYRFKPSPMTRPLPQHNQLHVNTFAALLPLFSLLFPSP